MIITLLLDDNYASEREMERAETEREKRREREERDAWILQIAAEDRGKYR